ncbi:GlxA family transcriptional regulator [Cobetia sp. Dlab-2-AX]|uniref:GlxA family transcriptional regulator n=1 Tax=Cobetia sp. Dlab-2-AX TaxID=2954488 RepID=UPI002097CF4E|nr:GlxA family transcriptional regulator [Cobetia sp. Dlab-2-AX]
MPSHDSSAVPPGASYAFGLPEDGVLSDQPTSIAPLTATLASPAPADRHQLGIFLLPGFAMVALFSMIEPLRIANRLRGARLYQWTLASQDGAPVKASNGMLLPVDTARDELTAVDKLVVCTSFAPEAYLEDRTLHWLQKRAHSGCQLGGVDTGCFVLARAGLLAGKTVTLHWESLPEFSQRFDEVDAVESLYEISDDGFFCAGGSAPLDMSLELIRRQHGQTLYQAVREQLILDQGRLPASRQRGISQQTADLADPLLRRAITRMENTLEAPLSIEALAEELGLSWRQLERRFQQGLGCTPRAYHGERRLLHARSLLHDTRHGVTDIALACGFTSHSSFTRAFRRRFGITPTQARRQPPRPLM